MLSPLSHELLKTVFYDFEPSNRIAYFKAQANYTEIVLTDGHEEVSSYTLKFFSERLTTHKYIRVNRSYLVNREFVKSIKEQENGLFVTLKSGTALKVPRRKQSSFLKSINN